MQQWNRIVMLVAFLAAGIAMHGQEVSVRFSRESFTLGQVIRSVGFVIRLLRI